MELAPGERILWAGQPLPGLRFTSADIFLIPFSFAWLGFSIFWTVMAFRITDGNAPAPVKILFPLFGVPFILVGLYLAVGRFWHEARLRAQTYYGITSQRILALQPRKGFRSLDLKHLSGVTVIDGRGGEGSILFNPQNIRSFDRIPNVREVETILQTARAPHQTELAGGHHSQ